MHEAGPAAAAKVEAEPRGRILVCDDASTIRSFIRSLLEPAHECLAVPSAEKALAVLDSFQPDVVVSDVMMEGMSGYDLCEKLRSNPATASIPFVLLTSRVGDEERAKGLELGADDYLYKPIRPRELIARVASLLRLRRATVALEERTRELERSNRKLAETQRALVQSEKLATIGTLAAGVAHEINNPLAFMKAGLVHLLEALDSPLTGDPDATAELKEVGLEVMDGIHRIERIVKDLREFASDREHGREEVDLAKELELSWKLAELKAPKRHTLELRCEGDLRIRVVRHQIGQVLINLFVNAVQAMGDKPGTVRATARKSDGEVVISISDTGPGIPPEILWRVFDPFFTTKPPGQGTGLGLSVSYGIIRSMGGTIEVASPPGEGATFTIRLPIDTE